MAETKASPMPTDDLNDTATWPFPAGASEIVVRVCSRDKETLAPTSYQAIVRGADRRRVWGVGVRSNPVSALKRAIECFFEPKFSEASNVAVAQQEVDIRMGVQVEAESEVSVEDLLE